MASRNRRRILMLIRTLSGGGAELVVETLCAGLNASEFDVRICELNGSGEKAKALLARGYQVYSLSPTGKALSLPVRIRRLRRVITKNGVELVHSHSTDALADAAVCGRLGARFRHVHTFHFGNYPHLNTLHLRLERLFHRLPDELVAVGQNQAASIAETYDLDAPRIRVIWNGVNPRPSRVDRELIAPFIAGQRIVIGTIGTLIPQKGYADLLAVASELKRLGLPVVFLIVGGGPLRAELEATARAAGLEDTVVFLGWVKDASEVVLPAVDIFFQPSLWEAMSMVLLEAAAAGKAIVCTSVGEARRVITHGRTGLIVEPGDRDSMVRWLTQVVTDVAMRERLGQAARQDYLKHWTADRMVSEYAAMYRRLLSAPGDTRDARKWRWGGKSEAGRVPPIDRPDEVRDERR